MAIRIRPITSEEQEILDRWQRADNVVAYRRARILRLSAAGHTCPLIAELLGLHVATVRDTIRQFNDGGIPAITPQPRSGGRPRRYDEAVAEVAEGLIRQGPPPEGNRATWTLRTLATAIADRCAQVTQMGPEAVRRVLASRRIAYRRAKEWLTSPDPTYERKKRRRDRLLAWARSAPDGAAIWVDQSWFVRWPYRFWTWATRDALPRVAKRWNEAVETTALYAALDDKTQEAFLRWTGQPNSERTISFLEELMAHLAQKGKRFIVLFWDQASWHTSKRTRAWIRAYNQRAKQEGLPRLIVCELPSRSPWLMPLEPIFGWIKRQVLGDREFDTTADLQAAVEQHFWQRVKEAQERRQQAWTKSSEVDHKKSRSVL